MFDINHFYFVYNTPSSSNSWTVICLKSPAKINNGDRKSKSNPLESKPSCYFVSDKGCTAGKSCKWQRSWESLPDKAERCWICGSKEHRKNDCRLKSSTTKKLGEPSGSGGGTGHGRGGAEMMHLALHPTLQRRQFLPPMWVAKQVRQRQKSCRAMIQPLPLRHHLERPRTAAQVVRFRRWWNWW